MTVAATTTPVPGWYPDPHDQSGLRWWDGSFWTDFTSPALPAVSEPAVPPSETPFVATTSEPGASVEVPAIVFDSGAALVFEEPAHEAFSFRARPLATEPEPVGVDAEPEPQDELPIYTSPLATIASPVPENVVALVATSLAPPVEVAPEPEPEPEPEPVAHAPAEPAPEPAGEAPAQRSKRGRKKLRAAVSAPIVSLPTPVVQEPEPAEHGAKRFSRRPSRKAAVGAAAVVVAAAGAAGATNLITGDGRAVGDAKPRGSGRPAAVAVDKACLQEWNTSIGGDAAQQRVTLGQFAGAYARMGRVAPLPGTLMDPQSCGLTVYDPSADTNVVFVSGVKDKVGYLDVTGYPRATRQYGWPKSEAQANVTIREDGSLRVKES